jgi:hypothetical protein
MKKRLVLLFGVGLLILLSIVGCGSSATPTPAPTVAPQVITVVVTATLPPATETSAAPTITPLPTVNTTETQAAATLAKPTTAPVTAKPAATKKPAPPPATATPTPLPLTLPAPVLIGPNFNPDQGQKDERHFPADDLIFEWQSIGPLSANVCYMIRVDFAPGAGDSFLQCDPTWTQKAQAQTVQFILYRPNRAGPTYGGLLPNPPGDLTVKWSVTVVADQGPGTGPVDPRNGVRHKVEPLSPKSDTDQFPFKGSGL